MSNYVFECMFLKVIESGFKLQSLLWNLNLTLEISSRKDLFKVIALFLTSYFTYRGILSRKAGKPIYFERIIGVLILISVF